jgi:hypothetical protein
MHYRKLDEITQVAGIQPALTPAGPYGANDRTIWRICSVHILARFSCSRGSPCIDNLHRSFLRSLQAFN